MNNVTRYELEIHEGGGEVVTSETGGFVDYDDYLYQLQQTDALQTSLNNIINAFGISGEGAHSKLVIEYVHGLVAENSELKQFPEQIVSFVGKLGTSEVGHDTREKIETAAKRIKMINTDAAIAEIKAQGRVEGVIFTANRMLAAWEHGFINESEEKVADITGAVLGMLEFLPKAEASELTREYADEVRARIAANLRAGRKG